MEAIEGFYKSNTYIIEGHVHFALGTGKLSDLPRISGFWTDARTKAWFHSSKNGSCSPSYNCSIRQLQHLTLTLSSAASHPPIIQYMISPSRYSFYVFFTHHLCSFPLPCPHMVLQNAVSDSLQPPHCYCSLLPLHSFVFLYQSNSNQQAKSFFI